MISRSESIVSDLIILIYFYRFRLMPIWVVCFEVLSRYLSGKTYKNHKRSSCTRYGNAVDIGAVSIPNACQEPCCYSSFLCVFTQLVCVYIYIIYRKIKNNSFGQKRIRIEKEIYEIWRRVL